MRVRITQNTQLTLPEAVLAHCPDTEYFDVSEENGRIVLTPARLNEVDTVRSKLAEQGIQESDVAHAVQWARRSKRTA